MEQKTGIKIWSRISEVDLWRWFLASASWTSVSDPERQEKQRSVSR